MIKIGNLEIRWLGHASFKISGQKVIYVDPYLLKPNETNADLIIITHNHHDHCDKKSIKQLIYEGTHIIAADGCESQLLDLNNNLSNKIIIVKEGDNNNIFGIKITAFTAYNLDKRYHPKGYGVGYILEIQGKKLYFAGDTDFIPEMKDLAVKHLDIAFVPVGGKYTMNAKEAAEAVKVIKPKIAVPMHYGKIVGSKKDAEEFKKLVGNVCEVNIMEKE